ncbi:MAG: hypothetical protein H7199_10460 [Burkholderiales bacterium]|nr:hypothetical protein [Flavobacterium sp.]
MKRDDTTCIFGLDLFGVMAISLVLLAQCIWIFPQSSALISQLASLFHFIGIEILLVLAGFLMGTMAYKQFLNDNFGWPIVWIFLKNQVFTILVLYFFALLSNVLIAVGIGYPIEKVWRYLFFLQNLASEMPAFFPESWVLPVIIFAMILFLSLLLVLHVFLRDQNKSKIYLGLILLLIVLCMVLKWFYNLTIGESDMKQWDRELKSVVIYRMDSVFIGMLSSWMLYHFKLFFARFKIIFAFFGLVGIVFIFIGVGYFQLTIEHYKLFWNVLYLPMVSLFLVFFLPFLSQWRKVSRLLSRPMAAIVKISPAIYLFHFSVVLQLLRYWLLDFFTTPKQLVGFCTIYLILVLMIGTLTRYCTGRILRRQSCL